MKNKSISTELRRKGKSSQKFEHLLNRLTLEELILLKLEISARHNFNGKFYGFDLWKSLRHIINQCVFRFALTMCNTEFQARTVLGVNRKKYDKLKELYDFNDAS